MTDEVKKRPIRNNRNQIVKALEKSCWNKAKATRLLGVLWVTLYKMMKKHRIKENKEDKSLTAFKALPIKKLPYTHV